MVAYLVTVVANTVRISIALQLRRMFQDISWLTPNQLHRLEGIFIYFGFLLLLFMVSEKLSSENPSGLPPHTGRSRGKPGLSALLRKTFFPLLLYYVTTLGIPLANSAHRPGTAVADFREHFLFVLLTPLLLILPLAGFCLYRDQRKHSRLEKNQTDTVFFPIVKPIRFLPK